ncbi:protein kinase superfamily protein isoform X2 [Wolffia australiana]
MKHILKKLHRGSHDGGRSSHESSAAPSTSQTPSISDPPPSPGEGSVGGSTQGDYFASEEEFQVQLALAISASNSDQRIDPDGDQIRAATLLSLGKDQSGVVRDEKGAAEALSRQYWDYNVLDYGVKVIDGFYDIFGLSVDHAGRSMPSLADLQANIGDLGFEVIIINRAIDPALVELEQIAQCVALDCRFAGIELLVQRISDLVTEHMGGPVRDANDMVARWVERSSELRTSLHTSLLPIGGIRVGLSRHRALLFKVLADHIGIPCKLVKGNHYTGIDDDAVDLIKLSDREFLVDLMAAPGTLIPADALNGKEPPSNSGNNIKRIGSGAHKPVEYVGISSGLGSSQGQSSMESSSRSVLTEEMLSSHKKNYDISSPLDGPDEEDTLDSRNLFADLNPFLSAKSSQLMIKSSEGRRNEPQRRRDNAASGPGRPPLPLVWKNRSTSNDYSNNSRQGNFPRKNLQMKDHQASASSSSNSISVDGVSSEIPRHISSKEKRASANGRNNVNEDIILMEKPRQIDASTQGLISDYSGSGGPHPWKKMMGADFKEEEGASSALDHFLTQQLDPMLDDVAECEILWEDLVIGERIGLGSYGEVYRADWKAKEVAVKKFLDQDFYGDALDEFRREVRIMRRLRHPNVVLFMGAVTRPPHLSIVTEFLPRGSLYRILHRSNSQIDERQRIKMALDVAMGMNCLHTSSPTIVHRDLKSPNLLVDMDWNVKVCDFGLSRLKHNTFLSSKSTGGTPEWMAPEVLRNEPSNEKCDVYSFGVILWELATLRLPWSGMNPMQVVGAVGFQNRRLEIPKDIDPLVERIIWQCWQTDPSLRPSFAQLTAALKPLKRLVISVDHPSPGPPVHLQISVHSNP